MTFVRVEPTLSSGLDDVGLVAVEIVGLLAGSTFTRFELPLEIFPATSTT